MKTRATKALLVRRTQPKSRSSVFDIAPRTWCASICGIGCLSRRKDGFFALESANCTKKATFGPPVHPMHQKNRDTFSLRNQVAEDQPMPGTRCKELGSM